MREIKFRVWDKNNNQMFQVHNLSSDFSDEDKLGFLAFTLMQYTGLKDKNGIEIYEGDIVKARSKRVNCVYEVYWEERGCQFRCCAHRDRQFDKTHLMDWADEVIGNIYENPELLKVK